MKVMIYDPHCMKIDDDTLVSIDVSMYDAQGELIDKTDAALTYRHGHGDIFSRIEDELRGKVAGDEFSLQLQPEEAFGDYDPELVTLVPVEGLGEGVTIGMQVEGVSIGASEAVYIITDIAEGMALLDGNHVLAGYALRFNIKVIDVRAASAEEVAAADTLTLPEFLHMAPSGRTLH